MSEQDNVALIDALADYFVMRGAQETKAEMVDKLTAMSEAQLRQFADMTVADVEQGQAVKRQAKGTRRH